MPTLLARFPLRHRFYNIHSGFIEQWVNSLGQLHILNITISVYHKLNVNLALDFFLFSHLRIFSVFGNEFKQSLLTTREFGHFFNYEKNSVFQVNIIISIFPMENPPYDNVRVVSSLEEAISGAGDGEAATPVITIRRERGAYHLSAPWLEARRA